MTQMTQTQDGDEISACAVSWRMGSLSLHHGSDIPNNATYNFLEDQMLLRLDLQKSGDGRLCKREPGPMPLMDAPCRRSGLQRCISGTGTLAQLTGGVESTARPTLRMPLQVD